MTENKKQTGRLSSYNEGDQLVVCRIEGPAVFKKRIMEMGFIPGEKISIVKRAPLKDPLELLLKNYHLALRVSEAEKIYVMPVDGGCKEFEVEGVRRWA
jgi:Fe2+ transport system protein FeoA